MARGRASFRDARANGRGAAASNREKPIRPYVPAREG